MMNWLKKIREQNGLSQKQLANKSGINISTIQNIEQEKRKGTEETVKKILEFFENESGIHISYNSDELIKEIKADIDEFGEDKECLLIYKVTNSYIVFTNYDFIVDEKPFDPKKELKDGEYYMQTTLKYALEVFERQNRII